MRLRFGLDGGEDRTHEQVGAIMGLSRETVRKLTLQALRRLREASAPT